MHRLQLSAVTELNCIYFHGIKVFNISFICHTSLIFGAYRKDKSTNILTNQHVKTLFRISPGTHLNPAKI